MQDVHKLRVFAAVAQYLSFTRAAQALFLTQSAVSHTIAALEAEVNCPLFQREGRRISMTEPGRVLLTHSKRIFAALDEAAAAVKRAARPELGLLRVGASPAACQYLVPESLREFRESYPDFELAISVGDSPHIARQLHEGAIDLGLMIRTERDKQLTFHDLFSDELGLLVSPFHAWAKEKSGPAATGRAAFCVVHAEQFDLSPDRAAFVKVADSAALVYGIGPDGGDQGTGEAGVRRDGGGGVDRVGRNRGRFAGLAKNARAGAAEKLVDRLPKRASVVDCGTDFSGTVPDDGAQFEPDVP